MPYAPAPTLTVGELIADLQRFDPSLPVLNPDQHDGGYNPIVRCGMARVAESMLLLGIYAGDYYPVGDHNAKGTEFDAVILDIAPLDPPQKTDP